MLTSHSSGRTAEFLVIKLLLTKLGIKVNPRISALSFDLSREELEDHTAESAIDELLQQDVRTDYSYFSFGVEHLIKNNRKIFWSYSRVNINGTRYDIGDLNEQYEEVTFIHSDKYVWRKTKKHKWHHRAYHQ